MRIRFLIVLLFLSCLACNTEKKDKSNPEGGVTETGSRFDKMKWRTMEGTDYPYRDQMLDDIVYNDTIRSLHRHEILELLGEPDRVRDDYLYYLISQDRLGFWPLHTKTLVIKLSKDKIDWIKIHD